MRTARHRARQRAGAHLSLTVAIVCATAIIAEPAHAQSETRFSVYGSNAIGSRLMPALIEAYARSRGYSVVRAPGAGPERETLRAAFGVDPAFSATLERLGSDSGFRALRDGRAEIAMSSRPIDESEAEPLEESLGVTGVMTSSEAEHVMALDGIALLVADGHPLSAARLETIARIFSGAIVDWSEIALPPGRIVVHAEVEDAATLDLFQKLVMDPFGLSIRDDAVRHFSGDDLAAAVAADPNAIGVGSLSVADPARALEIDLGCGVIVGADRFSVQSEEYPLGRRLYLYTKGAPQLREVGELIDFALSEDAQTVIAEAGFVDQAPQAQDRVAHADRVVGAMQLADGEAERSGLRRFVDMTSRAARLSPTFRFLYGGDELDAKAIYDAGRLARWLEEPENADAQVILMGFADSVGGYEANEDLSRARAEAVRRAMLVQVGLEFDPGRIDVEAFSTIAPIACNDTEFGRSANRRVEVWLVQGE